MTVGTVKPPIYSDFSGLTRLKAQAAAEHPEALQQAARQFEALFIQMMLKSMRTATPGDSLMGSDQEDMYRDLYDKQMSLHLSEQNGLGLADIIVRQLSQGQTATPPTTSPPIPSLTLPSAELQPLFRSPRLAPQQPASVEPVASSPTSSPAGFSSPSDFVRQVWPHAQRAGRELGVDPRVLVAQTALETGWGRAVIQHGDGRSANNLFGIKADAGWDGERVARQTMEFRAGVMVRERAEFRAYESIAASFDDYVSFIKSNPRYEEALAASQNGAQWSRELQRAGYATDPDYARKINGIMHGAALGEALGDLKLADADPIR